MQFTPKKSFKRFQQGGTIASEEEMPEEKMMAPEEATQEVPQEAQQENPLIMLAEGAMQALQNQDCQIAMQVCQGLIQVLQQMQEPAPQETTGEPVFKKGGVLIRRIKK